MKNLFVSVFILLLSSTAVFAQEGEKNTNTDPKLIGSWKGEEKDKQYEGVEKHWVQHRFEDGTYLILFTAVYHKTGKVKSFAEKGKWWIEDGKFYEQHSGGDLPEVYTYSFIDDDHVKFKIDNSGSLEYDDPNYEFIDIRILEDNL